ncbi:MAG: sulfite exporter TauE/SafE family protein [Candidatus Odinarchaeia archaeon]
MDIFAYFIIFLIAVSISIVCSMIGIGGNSIFIPILIVFFGVEVHNAIATMLFCSMFIAISSVLVYAKNKVIDYKLALILEITTASGAFIASQISILIESYILEIIFAIAMMAVAVYMAVSPYIISNNKCDLKSNSNNNVKRFMWNRTYNINGKKGSFNVNLPLALTISFFAGFMVGLIGVAGGTIKVPLIHIVCGAPIILAVGTSFFMIILTGFSATLGYLASNLINFVLAIPIIFGFILGSQFGSRIALNIKQKWLKIIFSIVLFSLAILIII